MAGTLSWKTVRAFVNGSRFYFHCLAVINITESKFGIAKKPRSSFQIVIHGVSHSGVAGDVAPPEIVHSND